MGFDQLRRHFLLAMGLPLTASCWHGDTAPSPTPPSRSTPPDQPSFVGHIAQARVPHAGRCTLDEWPETICGGARDAQNQPACGARGDSLTSYGDSSLVVT